MRRGLLIIGVFVSTIFFPWPLTALLAIGSSLALPLLPLSTGIFFDTLYYTPAIGLWPLGTLCGALVTALAFFVRSRLNAGIIGR